MSIGFFAIVTASQTAFLYLFIGSHYFCSSLTTAGRPVSQADNREITIPLDWIFIAYCCLQQTEGKWRSKYCLPYRFYRMQEGTIVKDTNAFACSDSQSIAVEGEKYMAEVSISVIVPDIRQSIIEDQDHLQAGGLPYDDSMKFLFPILFSSIPVYTYFYFQHSLYSLFVAFLSTAVLFHAKFNAGSRTNRRNKLRYLSINQAFTLQYLVWTFKRMNSEFWKLWTEIFFRKFWLLEKLQTTNFGSVDYVDYKYILYSIRFGKAVMGRRNILDMNEFGWWHKVDVTGMKVSWDSVWERYDKIQDSVWERYDKNSSICGH